MRVSLHEVIVTDQIPVRYDGLAHHLEMKIDRLSIDPTLQWARSAYVALVVIALALLLLSAVLPRALYRLRQRHLPQLFVALYRSRVVVTLQQHRF